MNTHTASEHAAAIELREHAKRLSAAYTQDPQDLAAARLALLMVAAQQEARAQGFNATVVFSHGEQE